VFSEHDHGLGREVLRKLTLLPVAVNIFSENQDELFIFLPSCYFSNVMSDSQKQKIRPDIRMITRMVPPEGNLVQGQSELPINIDLAKEAAAVIAANGNHYGGSEGDPHLRQAIAEKLKTFNGIEIDPTSSEMELMVTNGGTGALIGVAQSYLRGKSALVLEPYYPYHRKIFEEFGARTESFALDSNLEFDADELRKRCVELKNRAEYPLKAIVVCTPANPSGKILRRDELEKLAAIAIDLDLMVISDEVYEHYVTGDVPHIPIATLPGMWERTITVNSFSKSWNISGWRLGYCYGGGGLISKVNTVANIVYVCPVTPLQSALSKVLMKDPSYYDRLRTSFDEKRKFMTRELSDLGFSIYPSGSAFYLWAKIPDGNGDALEFNGRLMKDAGVAFVPGSAFADTDNWDSFMRICIAREDSILDGVVQKLRAFLK
jgi:aminotransferase